ncbi:TusE/DsrC/DsvC family sulfur relay protein [Buchnera aphidicola (Macrosiphoniella sanborni)]|uniref:Sulfurtransferase n=1 Tax=Buchnera aphidicola (Macrosiphoniella sanborni) TaxID=1241865 RepID=A0A4D6Y361_9GAMM|nr:TusE/DsrC/DsvC family sulfur relay protein [Buchnera aphidicola]QCI23976.1 TusE/DsrC/DsvC family sulfur relay protein [Buchnera aphidicola (Macrosiphoniella sanborni)]
MNIKNKNTKIYKKIEKDSEGYLKKTTDWNINIAKEIAKIENINLSADHWKIIIFIRKFYLKFKITPSMRMLIISIKKKMNCSKINSIYLFQLFPKGPAQQASKIAGIPKPNACL